MIDQTIVDLLYYEYLQFGDAMALSLTCTRFRDRFLTHPNITPKLALIAKVKEGADPIPIIIEGTRTKDFQFGAWLCNSCSTLQEQRAVCNYIATTGPQHPHSYRVPLWQVVILQACKLGEIGAIRFGIWSWKRACDVDVDYLSRFYRTCLDTIEKYRSRENGEFLIQLFDDQLPCWEKNTTAHILREKLYGYLGQVVDDFMKDDKAREGLLWDHTDSFLDSLYMSRLREKRKISEYPKEETLPKRFKKRIIRLIDDIIDESVEEFK